jgi:MoaA/NifB/PqqE/SkfB family radical SAM enzyme
MEEENKFNLAAYMSDGIRKFMAAAYRNVLSNPREARFVQRMRRVAEQSAKKRREVLEREGLAVPPFLIASIATTCNLHCKGCYARSNGIAEDNESKQKATLTPEQWRNIFAEAASLGVNFTLLAGGEPMMRRDVIEAVASVKEMIFPVFTNGTLIGPTYIDLLKRNLNIIPVISIEGTAMGTDERRGKGVFERAMLSMDMMKQEDLIFGASITVTSENMKLVTSPQFIELLRAKRCRLLFYIEYVPIEKGTEHLALNGEQVTWMADTILQRRNEYSDIIFFSFPGDEKETGGCIASGRGFFHIGPDGSAEPCPFSPFSDSNVLDLGVKGALQSPLFRTLRDASILGWAHTGGCTLYEHQDEVEAMMNKLKNN